MLASSAKNSREHFFPALLSSHSISWKFVLLWIQLEWWSNASIHASLYSNQFFRCTTAWITFETLLCANNSHSNENGVDYIRFLSSLQGFQWSFRSQSHWIIQLHFQLFVIYFRWYFKTKQNNRKFADYCFEWFSLIFV